MSTDTDRPARAPEWHGIALVLVGAFCFSLAIPFIRWTDGLASPAIAFYRALSAWLFLWLLVGLRFREALDVRSYRASIKWLIALGVVVGLTVSLYTYSIQNTTAAVAALLVNSAPIYVALLAPLVLHEQRAPNTLLSLALAVVGTVLVSDPASLRLEWSSLNGIAAAALSGATYGVALLIGRSLSDKVSGLTQNLWSQGITVLLLLPFALQAPVGAVRANLHLLIPMGVFSLGLSYLLYFWGLQRTSAQVVSIVALFEPVSGVVMGAVLFDEIPNLLGVLGGLLILVSIALISVRVRIGPRLVARWAGGVPE